MYKVKVETKKQFDIVLSSDVVSDIILSRDSFGEKELADLVIDIKKKDKKAFILMERISRYEEDDSFRLTTDRIYEIKNLDGIIIQNLDSYAYMLRKINKSANSDLQVELNYTMDCYNVETKKVLTRLYNEKRINAKEAPLFFTAPVELNIYELNDVGYDTFLIYSYIDTMVSANCLYKNIIEPNKKNVATNMNAEGVNATNLLHCKYKFDFNHVNTYSSHILDRKNKKLHYKTYCKYCYNKIFNTEPLYLIDKIDEIESIYSKGRKKEGSNENNARLNTLKYRIDFSFENEEEVKNILKGICPESFTRGHFKTSIK